MNPEHGGPSQGIRNMVPALEALGVHNEILCFDSPDASYVTSGGFVIHALGQAKGPYAYNVALENWLADNLGKYDVVVIHGLWLYNSYGTYNAWEKYKKKHSNAPKLYVMPHGMLDPYFQKAKERRLKALRNTVFYAFLERKVINNSNGILFTCQQELLLAREPFKPYRPKAELNIGYGIQAPPAYSAEMDDAFYAACPGLTKTQPFLLFLSRIHQKKGTDLLLKAYVEIIKNADLPALVIAGPGIDTEYGKGLLEFSAGNEKIFFPGMLKGNQKWGGFYNCEAFILPSHQENFGIAVVEAMACRKAILTTDKVNIWREIHDGDGGIVNNDDLDGTLGLINDWNALSATEKEHMGNNAYKVYRDNFSVEEAAQKLKTILEEQING